MQISAYVNERKMPVRQDTTHLPSKNAKKNKKEQKPIIHLCRLKYQKVKTCTLNVNVAIPGVVRKTNYMKGKREG